jgi:transposase
MIRSIGLDVHKRVIEACAVDEAGEILFRRRFSLTREELLRFARQQLEPTDQVALEATTNAWAVSALIEDHVARVVVSNPLQTHAIARAKVKTDKVDALVLAQLLRCDFLPAVWRPDVATRQQRRLSHRRATLVKSSTAVQNRIHSILHEQLSTAPEGRLFRSTEAQRWLRELPVDEETRGLIDSELRLLASIQQELEALDDQIARLAWPDERVRLLMTLPGVDVTVAHTVLAALGDIDRFADGHHAASYLGLVPSTKQSAERCYHGPITKAGAAKARWMLIQAAQHLDKHPGPLGAFFRRLLKKKNRNVAVVAVARKLVVIAIHMLKNNEPYRYAPPRRTEEKLQRLRVKATGAKRPPGLPPLAERPPGGTNRRTRSLADVCAREGLPPVASLREGELRMLRETRTLEAVEAHTKMKFAADGGHRAPQQKPCRTTGTSGHSDVRPAGCGGQAPTSSQGAHSRPAAGPADLQGAQGAARPGHWPTANATRSGEPATGT